MEDTYRFLRRVEHRLQIMFDRQTHEMPRDLRGAAHPGHPHGLPAGQRLGRPRPARRSGSWPTTAARPSSTGGSSTTCSTTPSAATTARPSTRSSTWCSTPSPAPEFIAEVLAPYPFRDRPTAYHNLMALAREDFPFLSQARCRHFLAAIAPRLLEAVGRTPDPDMTLTNLEKVSASLGAKAILWELFNFNPPSLRLYVELCATSQFLSEILINNPGMIDDLMDSLVVDRPVPGAAIKAELAELCQGAEDLAPILWSFRNKEWVRIGTRDILGREPIREVTRELADVAEAIVTQVARDQWDRRAARFGTPRCADDGRRDRWAILGLGKFGGRELNYHSDLDLVFLHEADGMTAGGPRVDLERAVRHRGRPAAAQGAGWRIVRRPALRGRRPAPAARCLRPAGPDAGARFSTITGTPCQTWERMSLTRARVIFATGGFGREVTEAMRSLLMAPVEPAVPGRGRAGHATQARGGAAAP